MPSGVGLGVGALLGSVGAKGEAAALSELAEEEGEAGDERNLA